MAPTVFTIGHSTHAQEYFIELLSKHGVTAVCDVRSMPHSRMNPQFNREPIRQALRQSGLQYVFLGKELGARSDDPACYENGKIRYDRVAETDLFGEGLARVRGGMQDYRVALMCAEKEPLECHRTILVARHLVALGLDVQHIHADGSLEAHTAAINRLKQMFRLTDDDLFRTSEELSAEAYERQERRIAYELDADAGVDDSAIRSAAG